MSKAGMGLNWGWQEIDVVKLRGALTVSEASRFAGVARRTWQRWEVAGRMPKDALERFTDNRKREGVRDLTRATEAFGGYDKERNR